MSRSDILRFFRDPKGFSASVASPERWLSALREVALPAIEAARTANPSTSTLRPAQIGAWEAIANQRIGLILGPPGTGKTFALSWMALAYLEAHRRADLPCRVLITAFTRAALLNVLEGIAEKARNVLGVESAVHLLGEPQDTPLKPGVKEQPLKGFAAAIAPKQAVVGCTTWGLYKALEKGWHGGPSARAAEIFDLICIDEASQLQVPQALMALAGLREHGRVLVAGDNKQLAPIGGDYNWSVDGKKLGGSVYDFLLEAGVPEHRLLETFRLNEPLADFPSRQFYGGEYFSAANVKDQRLKLIPGWENGLEPWEKAALSPEYPITVLLHDGPAAGTRNTHEVALVARLVGALWQRVPPRDGAAVVEAEHFWSEQLAVVSPHRAQNAAIQDSLSGSLAGDGCIVETVERIQGKERDAIIASYTVADPEFALAEAEFLLNPQRFNVSLTRARSKFILILSRALLEIVPPDEHLFDAAQLLREFVFGCQNIGTVSVETQPGTALHLTLCVRTFNATSVPLVEETKQSVSPKLPLPPMNQPLLDAVAAIRDLSKENVAKTGFRNVAEWEIAKRLARPSFGFTELRALQLNGYVTLDCKNKKNGGTFWAATPLDPPRVPLPCDSETVRSNLEQIVLDLAASKVGPLVSRVRDFFAWVDEQQRDVFRPILDALVREGFARIELSRQGYELVRIEETPQINIPLAPPPESLSDGDFAVLNALEDHEARRINFGIFEGWSRADEIAKICEYDRHQVAESLRRLDAHGYVMRTDDELPRVRSRMAELAREVRYAKQRFKVDDASERPYLVRSIKVIARNRTKPVRNRSVAKIFADLRTASMASAKGAGPVLAAMEAVLLARWGSKAQISGFQERSLQALLAAWLGLTPLNAAVITADTGAGKTEAACLPLLIGAAIDALDGIQGVRAVLVYPRVRLAANQSQRLVGYLREFSAQLGMPLLTIGMQTGDVPVSWARTKRETETPPNQGDPPIWEPAGPGRWKFPFFGCPACDKRLTLAETGRPQDRLQCDSAGGCGWSFEGWVGTKDGLRKAPPHIFLPVTESLNQWMQQPRFGLLFGDRAGTKGAPAPPRAVLADEIHLYSQVSGAQVGYTLRRLLARMKANGVASPLAIGMSATLGDPARVWSELIGVNREGVLHIGPTPAEREVSVRGREYFYFVQPEVESRGHDIAGASTTIQTLMCLAHGMRRRTGREGGFRGIVFLDSIDKVKRLHGDYRDAEEVTRLARLRTKHTGATPRCSSSSDACGHQPWACDRFRDGECWYFAASDPAQWTARGRYVPGRSLAVCSRPVYSANRSADEILRLSDLIFSTSSLEVGFDDPDMMLVYQHYAPLNLASFVQRKGRGGRGADDRPVTGITLSVYSPRDTWYFRAPERMLDAADFEVPLNTDNYFVRRGQVLSLLLDWAARWISQGHAIVKPALDMDQVITQAAPALHDVFGPNLHEDLGVKDLQQFWQDCLREASEENPRMTLKEDDPRSWAGALPQVPARLFDPINLPLLRVGHTAGVGDQSEDVTLAFSECAPGKGTRRWGHDIVHWNPYNGARAPMFPLSEEDCVEVRYFKLDPLVTKPEDAAKLLPREARALLGAPPAVTYVRPVRVPVQELGKLSFQNWIPFWEYDELRKVVQRRAQGQERPVHPAVHHKSNSRLLGTVIAVADLSRAVESPVTALLGPTRGKLLSFKTHRQQGRRTGLRVTHAYWGVDVSLVVEKQAYPMPERDTHYLRQIFTKGPNDPETLIFGYGMESEGIALNLDSEKLDRFIEEELGRQQKDHDEQQWLRSQYFRYLIATSASSAGINSYQAKHLAELMVSAAALPELRAQLGKSLKTWSWDDFRVLLVLAFNKLLSESPTLTAARLDAMVDDVRNSVPDFRNLLQTAMRGTGDDESFRGWLRSAILHGVAIRLKELFVLHGRGDERKVLLHAALPIQYNEGLHDRVTVCEKGSFGDGTTRTFLGRAEDAFGVWAREGIVACSNARSDQALFDAFEASRSDPSLRRIDPANPTNLEQLARRLRLDLTNDASALQLVVRLLCGYEEVYGERFDYYDLYQEIQAVRASLRDPQGGTKMLREPGTWELVGAVVDAAATQQPLAPRWSRLLEVYGGLEDASLEEGLAPRARLADQIYRISARLCPDGCQACLHLGSDLMDDDVAAMTVSRRLLERYWHFVQSAPSAPLTPQPTAPAPSEPTAPPAAQTPDRSHLFPSGFGHLFAELQQIHRLALDAGADILGENGRVVGATIGEVTHGKGALHLVDERAPWAKLTAATLRGTGRRAVIVNPRDGAEQVLDALES